MEILWAPWRMQFIKELRENKGGCVFCELPHAEGGDRKNLVLFKGKTAYVLMNKYPYNNGHLMVIPYKHASSLKEFSTEENAEIMKLCSASTEILAKNLGADGFNCGFNLGKSAGAGIADHVHLHVVPRWVGDANFLPILGKTRSIAEYIEDTYDRLIKDFSKLS